MKKNKLVWFKAYPKGGKGRGYKFDEPIKFLCLKDEVQHNKLIYRSPEYLTETSLLSWKELDNCNLAQRLIYKINFPNWVLKFVYTLIILTLGAWLNRLFR